ncbi:hypothetical protein ACCT17_34195 [Rhizobium ruizarguesonis]
MAIESVLVGYLERGEPYDVMCFGGIDDLLQKGSEAGASMMPELFIDMVLPYRKENAAAVELFVADVVEQVEDDLSLLDVSSRLTRFRILGHDASRRVFTRFLNVFADRNRSYSQRRAALRGAYLSALGNDRYLTRLTSRILELEDDARPDPRLLVDAAKIAGLLWSIRGGGDDLVDFLKAFEDSEGCEDQIKLELGLVELGKALQSVDRDVAVGHFKGSRTYFRDAYALKDNRYEAKSFSVAIDILVDFFEGGEHTALRSSASDLWESAFAYQAHVAASNDDPVLGSLFAQASAFTTMAHRLVKLTESFSEVGWLHPIDVIQGQLLVAYTANSMLMGQGQGEGLDLLTRPWIEESLIGNLVFMKLMEQWLHEYGTRVDPHLVIDIKQFLEAVSKDPTVADTESSTVSALIQRASGQEGLTSLECIIRFRTQRQTDNVSPLVVRVITAIEDEFRHLDHFQEPKFRDPFMDLAYGVIEFVSVRSNSSFEVNRNVAYLFKARKSNPDEKDLQQDFQDWSAANGTHLEPEPKGVGGGRGDLRYEVLGCRLYIEVKQEEQDCSFENLVASYSDQTSQYQVTSAHLGVMLVLDKSRPGQPPYVIEDALKPIVVNHYGRPRGILVARVSALRPLPSDASK